VKVRVKEGEGWRGSEVEKRRRVPRKGKGKERELFLYSFGNIGNIPFYPSFDDLCIFFADHHLCSYNLVITIKFTNQSMQSQRLLGFQRRAKSQCYLCLV
jgi:hypothetical protein